MGRLTTSLVSTHDPDKFITICFYIGPPDNSIIMKDSRDSDVVRRNRKYEISPQAFFRDSCSEFVDLTIVKDNNFREATPMPAPVALKSMLKYDIDILIDLTAHTTGGRLEISGSQPARIVANYLGYPGQYF